MELSEEIIDKSRVEAVGFVPDIYNLFRRGLQPEALTKLKYSINLMHINDAEDCPLEDLHVMYNRVFPGDGVANAKAWVQALLQIGYEGYFSLKLFRQEMWDISPQDAATLCYSKLQAFDRLLENYS